MKGYKGMKPDMTCQGMKFEIGKIYHIDGEIELCKNGFHFCKKLANVFSFYGREGNRFFEIEAKEPIISDTDKSVTAEIKIVRELSKIEVNRHVYGGYYGYGDGNGYGSGYGNYGNGCRYYSYGDNYCGYGDGYYGNGHGGGSGDGKYGGGGGGYGYDKNIFRILNYKE